MADGMEDPTDIAAPEPDPTVLLNTMAVDLKVCRELLQQAQASVVRVEAQRRLGHEARSLPGPASRTAAGQALGPPSVHYSLFRCLPEDCEWAQLLERQLRNRTFELLPPEQLAAAFSFLTEGQTEESTDKSTHYQSTDGSQYQSDGATEWPTLYQSVEGPTERPALYQSAEGPTERPALYQSAEGPTERPALYQPAEGPTERPTLYRSAKGPTLYQSAEGPAERHTLYRSAKGPTLYQSAEGPAEGLTLYQSALDLSSDHAQELLLRGGAQEEDLSDSRESSEEGPLSPTQPSLGLLDMEDGELSSIRQSPPPPPHKMLSVLFKRHLVPCNSTPRNTAEGDAHEESESVAEGPCEEAEGSPEGASEEEGTSGEESEGTVYVRDTGFALDYQLYPAHTRVRTRLTLDNEQDSAKAKIQDSAALCKEGSRSESLEEMSSGESLHKIPPGEPQWASLLSDSKRAHSTLDDILQAQIQED